jgi:hypothetical protein
MVMVGATSQRMQIGDDVSVSSEEEDEENFALVL